MQKRFKQLISDPRGIDLLKTEGRKSRETVPLNAPYGWGNILPRYSIQQLPKSAIAVSMRPWKLTIFARLSLLYLRFLVIICTVCYVHILYMYSICFCYGFPSILFGAAFIMIVGVLLLGRKVQQWPIGGVAQSIDTLSGNIW
jgi:hypothetical protein